MRGYVYADGTQTANAMALFLDLVPPSHRFGVARSLKNDIVHAHNIHVTTGFIGIKYLLPALTALGRSDLAYELAAQTTYPTVHVTIPVNSDSQIVIPTEDQMTDVVIREGERVVWEKGRYVSGDAGLAGARQEGRTIILEAGLGTYSFRLTAAECVVLPHSLVIVYEGGSHGQRFSDRSFLLGSRLPPSSLPAQPWVIWGSLPNSLNTRELST